MNYQQFVDAVEQKIRKEMREGMSVSVHRVMKNNGKSRMGLTVMEQGINVSPTIYLEEYFEQFQNRKSLDSIVKHILSLYQELRLEHSWKADVLKHYDQMKPKVAYKLIHAGENKELLKTVPYVPYLDLAIVFYVLLDINPAGTVTLLITNDILDIWGVGKDCVYKEAKRNTKKLLVPEFKTMKSIIAEFFQEQEEQSGHGSNMYVLTNHLRSFGAACILYEHVLEDIGNQLGENFYVLPSSVHEGATC